MAEYDGRDVTATPMHYEGETVKLKFCLTPHVCAISGKRLWFKFAYLLHRKFSNRAAQAYEIVYTHWVDKNEYIIWKLTH